MKTLCAWLGCLVLLLGMGACRLTGPGRPSDVATRPEVIPGGGGSCPTGQCDPDPNGLGIYIAEGHSYCFFHGRTATLCPEGFINTPEGVVMRVRSLEQRRRVLDIPVRLTPSAAPSREASPVLEEVHASPTDLYAVVSEGGRATKVRGEALGRLTFHFTLPVDEVDGDVVSRGYELTLSPLKGRHFQVLYREAGSEPWLPQCRSPEKAPVASVFLPARRVDGLNAFVDERLDSVTMACETGAIGACLAWGYQPWSPDTFQVDASREHVYRACLQAKRAAYFVGQGDLRAYTTNGTDFLRRDAHGFGSRSSNRLDELEHLEALWGPQGAVCLNPRNRRHDFPLPRTSVLPACASTPQWSAAATFATGVPRPLP
ncbi:ADYC domain-containing protein [Myxococcus eversor]|uniref:ADYC domain-containing protein n=1 Tax=Myxococcus eversor TaxID=2709661 RepID=UPI0013D7E59A|nr:ADYC domain-containing protein [Myxococcus eversor]